MPRLFRHATGKAELVPASVLYRGAAARAGDAVRRRWRREVCGAAGDGPTAMEKEGREGIGLSRTRTEGPGARGQVGQIMFKSISCRIDSIEILLVII